MDSHKSKMKQRNVFKGSDLVSALQERNPRRFHSRNAAYRFARKLFREGIIKSIFRANYFEDSAQLYMWQNDDLQPWRTMTSHPVGPRDQSEQLKSSSDTGLEYPRDYRLISDVRNRIRKEEDNINLVNSIFRDIEREIEEASNFKCAESTPPTESSRSNIQRQRTSRETSTDVSAVPASRSRGINLHTVNMTNLRDHDTIPEESQERDSFVSIDYDLNIGISSTIPSQAQSLGTVGDSSPRRWHDNQCPYSDNEKQLLDEIKRMKREHQQVLNTYEERINKLMAKMHELRSIAEMLENSSTKSSPYGILPKANLLNIIGAKIDQEKSITSAHDPPPLPPRPDRGAVVYPNKPIIQPRIRMKPLIWTRIILKDAVVADGPEPSIWETMVEPKIPTEELDKLFSSTDVLHGEGASLYDDIIKRRGRSRQQLTSVFDTETSRRVMYSMRMLRCTVQDVIVTASSLDIFNSEINQDGLTELLESLGSSRNMDKIIHHVRRHGAVLLDHPEYFLFELSKVDHFRERIEFLRFRYRLQWHLFEIDQQMREVYTACDEIINSTALKNILETLLAVGNYLNGGTQHGQADGYGLDILNTLKDIQDKDAKGNMLEFVLKMYCQFYEAEVEIGCATRFRLPEASNMRHAAQVSFDGLQDRLNNLQSELQSTRNKLLDSLGTKNDVDAPSSLGSQMENFYTSALEVISEQEKLLAETREVFHKTTYYFMHDSKCTSQEFFQIWATFLHDSKYYWRLAHRKLAKERFENDFRYKGQMSSSSVTAFGNLRSSLIRRISSLRHHGEPHSNKDQQIKHINKWIESIDHSAANDIEQVPPIPLKQPEEVIIEQSVTEQTAPSNRCPSPKPLTSSPPSSNVLHRPMPKPATSHTVVDNPVSLSNHNYENHNDLRSLTSTEKQDTRHERQDLKQRRAQIPLPSGDQSSKKPTQFSLKSWLKREQNRRTSQVDKVPEGPDQAKIKLNSGTFSKFRNTVMSRLSGNIESQRITERRARVDAWSPKQQHNLADSNIESQDTKQHLVGNTEGISEILGQGRVFNNLNVGVDHNFQVRGNRNRSSSNSPGRSSGRTDSRHSNDRLQPNTSAQNKVKEQYTDANYQAISKDFSGKMMPEASKIQSPQNELNNNAQSHMRREQSAGRLLAPVVIGSNIGVTNAYGPANEQQDKEYTSKANEAKLTKANVIPVYNARIMHNYENQTKWETPKARRQQAGAINSTSAADVHNKYSSGIQNAKTPMKSMTSGVDSYIYHTPGNMQIDKLPRDMQSNFSSVYGVNGSGKPVDNGDKSSMGPRALTSLIERFEYSHPTAETHKKQHSHGDADFEEQQVAMTSTPVTHRKELSILPDSSAIPQLPSRGDIQDPFPLPDSTSTKISPAYSILNQTPLNSQTRTNNYENPPGNMTQGNVYSGNTKFHSFAANEKYNTPVSGNIVSGNAFHGQSAFSANININTTQMKCSGMSRGTFSSPSGNQNHNSAGTNFRTTYGSENIVSPSESSNYNTPDLYSDCNKKADSGRPGDCYSAQLRKTASSSRMDRYMKPSQAQGRPTNASRSPLGPTTAAKPSIMQKRDITFMEI